MELELREKKSVETKSEDFWEVGRGGRKYESDGKMWPIVFNMYGGIKNWTLYVLFFYLFIFIFSGWLVGRSVLKCYYLIGQFVNSVVVLWYSHAFELFTCIAVSHSQWPTDVQTDRTNNHINFIPIPLPILSQ